MKIGSAIGKGLVAGLVGTAAMTAANTLEGKLLGRPRKHPAYWGNGAVWGLARPLLRAAGLSPGASTAAQLAGAWSSEQVLLPALALAPPSMVLGRRELALDAWNHALYAVAAGVAYELLDGRP
jgi:hypothetical protein